MRKINNLRKREFEMFGFLLYCTLICVFIYELHILCSTLRLTVFSVLHHSG